MEEITLCLRQEESVQVDRNGVYTTTLAHPIEVRPGDEVTVKSVFLDTSDIITIPEEGQVVTLKGCKYMIDYNINKFYDYDASNTVVAGGGVEYMATIDGTPAVVTNVGTNDAYWLANAITNASHRPYFILNFNAIPLTKGRGGARYGGNVTIQYTDPNDPDLTPYGASTTLHIASYQEDRYTRHNPIPVPSQARKADPTEFFTLKVASIDGSAQWRVDPTQELFELNIKEIFQSFPTNQQIQPITPTGGTHEIDPQIFTWSMTIPGGDYTPQEIAAVLTSGLVPIEKNGASSANYNHGTAGAWSAADTEFPTQSPLLTTVLQNEYELSLKDTGGYTNTQIFINASMTDPLNEGSLNDKAGTIATQFRTDAMKGDFNPAGYTPPQDRFIGTNQISVSFDENERKLKFDILHFPVYVNSTVSGSTTNEDAQPGVQYNDLTAGYVGNADSGLVKAYSGIAFTEMSPQSFWEGSLGFQDNLIHVIPNSAKCNTPSATTVNNSFTIDNFISGKTFTEAAATLSVPVVTTSALQYTGGLPGLFATPVSQTPAGTPIQVTVADVDAVFATKVYNDNIQESGYFLVDITNNFQMDFVSESTASQISSNPTNGKDTMSIVSRYYTQGNFVTDQGAGSIVYTHSGRPQNITSLGVRIKNPDGSFVDSSILGSKNTVFLSIQRAKNIHTGGAPKEIIEDFEPTTQKE